ncbi:MAG TPA: hypothetical protein VH987_03130 [Candidatus Limnocylindria bacterium]|jgi:hypothetical protein
MKPRRIDPLAMVLADIAGWPEPSDKARPKATTPKRRRPKRPEDLPRAA